MKGADLRLFIEQTPIAAAMFDREMRYLAMSPRWLSEYPVDGPMLGLSHYELFPEIPERWKEAHRRGLAGETLSAAEDCFVRADGGVVWMSWQLRPWFEADGTIGGIVIFAEDVTPRKRAEEALRLSEERHRYAMQATREGLWDWNIKTGEAFISPYYCAMLGYEESDFAPDVVRHWMELLHPDDRDATLARVDEWLSESGAYSCEFRLRTKDGKYRWILSRGEVVERDEAGAPSRAVGAHVDITERKQAEAALIESEHRFQQIADHTPALIWMSGAEKGCTYFNRTWLNFTGRALEQQLGDGWTACVHPNDLDRCLETYGSAFDARKPFEMEYRLRRHDGEYRWIRDIGVPRFTPEGEFLGYIGSGVDVTERRNAEEALRKSEERLSLAQSSAHIGIWDWDLGANETFLNNEYYDLYGLPRGASLTYDDFLSRVHPEDRQRVDSEMQAALSGGGRLDFQCRIVRADDCETRWIASKGIVFFDADGHPFRAMGAVYDITELKKIEEELLSVDRRKDEFLATLAHELRNPLGAISNSVNLLNILTSETSAAEEKKRASLARIERQVNHLKRIVDDLLEITRIKHGKIELKKERVELGEILSQAVDLCQPLVQENGHQLTMELPSRPLEIDGDPVRLVQVFGNLINNAVKFTDAGGRIDIAATHGEKEAIVSVRDNGAGLPPETLGSIFDMFAQVKTGSRIASGGIGVGLALSRGLILLHGGRIDAHSDGPGHGSEFVVRLPLAK
ncbi:PAS domain-containing protein [Methylocystis sp. WRRC1]|uniref:PAS domain-containing sensor histidine kinase n=1 Tax=Methylocystis sp. WRRC1 TaxID=1732014 RepID=UPI001D155986|nr:PAS domain-containing protein [Methylocystis sp. WRRC1]